MNESVAFQSALTDIIERAVGVGVERAVAEIKLERPAQNAPGFKWISNPETQKVTGWSRATLQRLRRSGKLPYAKVGSSIFYRRADLENLFAGSMKAEEASGK